VANAAIKLEISQSIERFHFFEAGLHELAQGPVQRDLIRRAIRVEAAAKSGWSAPPSEPGHKPSVRTGRLRGSITWRPGLDAISPFVDVGSSVVYAPYVELGTSRMAARPFLRPALEAARATF
jgi:hypothetical protein